MNNHSVARIGPARAARAGRGRVRPAHRAPRPVRALLATTATTFVVLVGAAGIALAYWHGSGTGIGSTTTGTSAAVTLSPAIPALTLYPGGQADVTLTVTNPNTSVVTIGSLALDATQGSEGFAVDAAHPGCSVSMLSFTTQTDGGPGGRVPGRTGLVNGSLAINLPSALTMAAGAANACQGARFTVYLVAGS